MKKKLLFVFLASLYAVACTTSRLSVTGVEEKAFVEKFLKLMIVDYNTGKGVDYKGMMDCISPRYLKTNKIDIANYKVNNYSVYNYSIEFYDRKKGIITVKIWGVDKKWVHRIEFKVSKEKGKLYLVPSRHSDSYIDPWQSVNAFIKE